MKNADPMEESTLFSKYSKWELNKQMSFNHKTLTKKPENAVVTHVWWMKTAEKRDFPDLLLFNS